MMPNKMARIGAICLARVAILKRLYRVRSSDGSDRFRLKSRPLAGKVARANRWPVKARPFSGPPITNDGALTVGSDEAGKYFLKGVVDEVYVLKAVLDEEGIAELMSEQIRVAVDPISKLTSAWGSIKGGKYY